jgi:hypothetical protein
MKLNDIISLVGWVIEIIIIFVRIAPIIITAKSKKRVEDTVYTFTLKLDYTNVFQWCSKHITFLMLNLIVLFSLIFIWFVFSHNFFLTATNTCISVCVVGLFIVSAISIFLRISDVFKRNFEYWVGQNFNGKEHYSFDTFQKRIVPVLKKSIMCLLFALVILYLAAYFLNIYGSNPNLSIIAVLMILLFVFTIEFLGCFFCFIIMMTLLPFIAWLLHLSLRGLVAFCWKIIKFDNGAFAALIMIIPAILGIINSCCHLFTLF